MAKLRVLQMMGAKNAGGAETFYVRLVDALSRRDELDVLPIVRTGSWAGEQLKSLGIPFETAPFGGWLDKYVSKRSATLLQTVTGKFQPHLIQSWMNRASLFMPQGPWATVARLGGYYDLKYYRGRVDHLIGITDGLCRHCTENGWPASRVSQIGNFAPLPQAGWDAHRNDTRAGYDIPENALVLFMSGRLHKVKGIDVTLRAMAQLPDDVWLLAPGSGPEDNSLRALSANLGIAQRVIFPGWMENVSALASAADVWLAPSRQEALGNTVLDAWAHAKPLIASKAPGPASLISHGDTGLLVAVESVEELRDALALVRTSAELRRRLASSGHERLLSDFTEQAIVEDYLALYNRLAGKSYRASHDHEMLQFASRPEPAKV